MRHSSDETQRGAAVYSPFVLSLYDLLIVRLSNTVAWRCHRNRMLDLYNTNVGTRHLDVGPGTGWYLANATLPPGARVTLADLNANSLDHARKRLGRLRPDTVVADVLAPPPGDLGSFDSVGANFLLHCVPGTWAQKGVAFENLGRTLDPEGVLFGATILGRGVRHNAAGRRLMSIYNAKGIFCNADDDAEGLEHALAQSFSAVEVEVVGTVALFRAARPVQQ